MLDGTRRRCRRPGTETDRRNPELVPGFRQVFLSLLADRQILQKGNEEGDHITKNLRPRKFC